jgi:hypothetical protein
MAEREGFEPSVGVNLHTLSKRAPSTARPPLPHKINRSIFVEQCYSMWLKKLKFVFCPSGEENQTCDSRFNQRCKLFAPPARRIEPAILDSTSGASCCPSGEERRGWDSNPRYPIEYNRFRVYRLRPTQPPLQSAPSVTKKPTRFRGPE